MTLASQTLVKFGPFAISWYSILYGLGFLIVYVGLARASQRGETGLNHNEFRRFLVFAAIGVLLFSRAFHVLIYSPTYYFNNPMEVVQYWKGGLAQHGALFGLGCATIIFSRVHQKDPLRILDAVFYLYPLAIFLGRVGNFINGELWGRVTTDKNPFGMVFSQAGNLPRHPSQLYEALGEGLLLFFVLVAVRRRLGNFRGATTVAFTIGYAIIRFVIEFFREPDGELYGLGSPISTGQALCLAMLAVGAALSKVLKKT